MPNFFDCPACPVECRAYSSGVGHSDRTGVKCLPGCSEGWYWTKPYFTGVLNPNCSGIARLELELKLTFSKGLNLSAASKILFVRTLFMAAGLYLLFVGAIWLKFIECLRSFMLNMRRE